MEPKVSIVIPVYNGSNYLAEAIESALGQTHKNLEVIVVNDGSSDNGETRRVAERYSGRIRYFEKPNGGVASALNFGITEMTGEYFSWLSHDDLYLPDKIEAQLSCLAAAEQKGNTIVYGNYAVFTRDPAQAQVVDVPDADRRYFRYLLATSSAVHGCTLLIPKGAFSDQRFDEAKPTTQDYDMWFRLAEVFDFVKLDRALVLARQHAEQGSVKKRSEVRTEKSAIYCDFLAALRAEDINPAIHLSPARAYTRIAAYYAKQGLPGAALAAVKKAVSCLSPRRPSEVLVTSFALVLVSLLGIPWGLARARVRPLLSGHRSDDFQSMSKMNRYKYLISNTPILGAFARTVWSMLQSRPRFPGSRTYWEDRYAAGGTSGSGSYNRLAFFKANTINAFVEEYGIADVMEFGCGDGNQLKLARYPRYLGLDISRVVVEKCRILFSTDATKKFKTIAEHSGDKADLALSLDVIYHIVEDPIFDEYMRALFDSARRYVIIYSSNDRRLNGKYGGYHVKHRRFTDWISEHAPDWEFLKMLPNEYPFDERDSDNTSLADFYFFKKNSS